MFRSILPTTLLIACFAMNARADIVIEVGETTVLQGTAGAILDIVISSDAADQPTAITGDFQILNATFLDPPGTFDQPGFFNEGNFDAASAFLIDAIDPSLAFLSLDIETPTAVPNSDVILAQLFVDSANLAAGDYEVQISNVFVVDAQGQVAAAGLNGSLTVTAIPEPASALMLGAVATLASLRRRRRR